MAKQTIRRGRGRPRKALPVVALKLPRCNRCNSANTFVKRPLLFSRGFVQNVRRCRECGQEFLAIWD